MANYITITEYSVPEQSLAGFPQCEWEPPIVDQPPLAIQAGHLESAAFNAATNLVRLAPNAACNILFSAAGTAAVADTNQHMAAGTVKFARVKPGSNLKVSVVAASA